MKQLIKFLREEFSISNEKIINDFSLYNELILKWNSKINLISRKQNSIEKNILDSVFFLTKHSLKGDERILDAGTGGGFPGIPLKIIYPDIKLTLLDSTKKKIIAVNDIITKMGLNNTDAVWGRAEEKSKEREFKGKYDVVIALAVSTLENIYKWCNGFLKKEGYIICLKGGDILDELKAFAKFRAKINIEIIEYTFNNFQDVLPYKKAVILKNKIQ
jgi:16S rRNA (guanine527-N7)-methyltransferase